MSIALWVLIAYAAGIVPAWLILASSWDSEEDHISEEPDDSDVGVVLMSLGWPVIFCIFILVAPVFATNSARRKFQQRHKRLTALAAKAKDDLELAVASLEDHINELDTATIER